MAEFGAKVRSVILAKTDLHVFYGKFPILYFETDEEERSKTAGWDRGRLASGLRRSYLPLRTRMKRS